MKVSIIIPAYNEEHRIKPFLENLRSFIVSYGLIDYEIVFVNDGSTDNTLQILNQFSKYDNNIKIVSYAQNKGKGYAVRKGIFNSIGEKVIFIDSDGSISPEEIPKMNNHLNSNDVVIGIRYSQRNNIKQPIYRMFTGTVFNLMVNSLFKLGISDTLCGFKGFKRNVAYDLFKNLSSDRWIFDVEILYKIKKRDYELLLLPIKWEHKDNSKIKLFDIIKILYGLFRLNNMKDEI